MANINEIDEIEEGLKAVSNEQGQCPICNSQNLTYGCIKFEDCQMAYYPVTCDDCGATYNEWYKLEFVSNDQIH